MSEQQRVKFNRHKHRREYSRKSGEELIHVSSRLKAPVTTLALLSWILTACGGQKNVVISLGSDYVTRSKDITVSGIPQGATNGLDSECTVITINGGADLLQSVPVVSEDFLSAHVDPKDGVQGTVTGTAQFGKKGPFGNCGKDFEFPFSLNVDTDPTVCQELSQGSGNVTLTCNDGGQIIDKNTKQVIATINSPASVPVDQNIRTRQIIIQDQAGNETEMEVSLATTCQQIPGVVRIDPVNQKVQIQLRCDGPGTVSIGQESTNVISGENWVNFEKANVSGNVNFSQHNTSFNIAIPAQGAPTIQLQNLRIEGGNLVAEAACKTSLGDKCAITLDGQQTVIPGDFTLTRVTADADIGAGHDITFGGSDTLGNSVSGTTRSPDYSPFANITAQVNTDPKNKLARVTINHPDPAGNIDHVDVQVVQHDPTENKGFNRYTKKGKVITTQASCAKNQGYSNANVTVYDCRLPYTSGRLEVNADAIEKGGEHSGSFLIPSRMPELSFIRAAGVEASPYGALLVVLMLGALGVSRIKRQYREAKQERDRHDFLEFMNGFQFPDDAQARSSLLKEYRKSVRLFEKNRKTYEQLLVMKLKLREVMEQRKRAGKLYSPEALNLYIDSYVQDETAEALLRTTLTGFSDEREGVKQTVLGDLDQFIKSIIDRKTDRVFVNSEAIVNENFISILKKIIAMPDDGWFWKEAQRKITVTESRKHGTTHEKRYPHISKESIRYLLLAFLKQPGKMEKHWDEYYELFRSAGVMIKRVDAKALQDAMRITQI